MNRQLKFRVWDKAENEFSDISEYDSLDWFDRFRDAKIPETLTVQQYTGLKDKNGVDIYEGDILNTPITEFGTYEILDFIRGPVTFEDGAFNFYGDHLTSAASKDMTIIGNIFENNELLEK
jgi:uncharacterized phage protein (TIGR01671 family)